MDQSNESLTIDINFKEYFFTLWRNKWIILIVFFGIMLVSILWTYQKVPRYRATARITIGRQDYTGTSQFNPWSFYWARRENKPVLTVWIIIQTKMQTFQSTRRPAFYLYWK